MQRLLSAGVRRPDGSEVPGGIQPVDPVDEDEPRVAHGPGRLDEQPEDVAGLFLSGFFTGERVTDRVEAVLGDGPHELVGYGYGDIEISEALAVPLHGDELFDVRMVDPQDPDVGAPPRAALFDRFGRGVDDPEERYRARGDALGFADEAPLWSQEAEIEARSASFLVDEGCILDGVEDRLHGVLDRQDETGAEAHVSAGPGQGGTIGQEVAVFHDLEELLRPFPAGRAFLGRGDRIPQRA